MLNRLRQLRRAQFDRGVRNTFVRIHNVWFGYRLRRTRIDAERARPAMILQTLLEKKWKLQPHDKDMIVMQHQFEFTRNGSPEKITSSLVVTGEDQHYTAMAKTVGLPLGIVAGLILEEKVSLTGIHIPVMKEIYEPVLRALEKMDIRFQEK